MSTIINYELKEFIKNVPISRLSLNSKTINILSNKEIYTILDVLTFSTIELKKIIGIKAFNELKEKMHNYKFKFIDELSIEEKKKIVKISPKKTVLNSSIYFIGLPTKEINKLKKLNINTILEIKENIDKIDLSKEIIKSLSNLEIDIGKYYIELDKNNIPNEKLYYLSNEELLNLPIECIDIPYIILYKLKRTKINIVKDVISMKKADLHNIQNIGEIYSKKIIDIIHSLGLYFKDEEYLLMKYYDSINKKLERR